MLAHLHNPEIALVDNLIVRLMDRWGIPTISENSRLNFFDPRIDELLQNLDPHLIDVLSHTEVSVNLVGIAFSQPKPGRPDYENGDAISLNKNGLLVADGIKPADMTDEERSKWPVSPDVFAAYVLEQAITEILKRYQNKSAPDPDTFKDLLIDTIVKFNDIYRKKFNIPLDAKDPSIIGGIVIDGVGKEKRVMMIGDGSGFYIMKNGSILPIIDQEDEATRELIKRFDIYYAALVANISNQELINNFIKESFEIKSITNGLSKRKLRKIVISSDRKKIEEKLGSNSFDQIYQTIPENAIAVVFGTDGMGPEEYLAYYLLKSFLSNELYYRRNDQELRKLIALNRLVNKTFWSFNR